VLRGANDYMLDEMDRALHDSLMVVKRMLESNALVAGGGAVEAALSIHLEKYATTLGSKEQLAIAEFADALLVIPRTLAVNAAQVGPWVWVGGWVRMWVCVGVNVLACVYVFVRSLATCDGGLWRCLAFSPSRFVGGRSLDRT
jgi:hypothetical protein